jgi:hypothetical protein
MLGSVASKQNITLKSKTCHIILIVLNEKCLLED